MTNLNSRQEARAVSSAKLDDSTDYKDWSNERLIQKVIQLEKELKDKSSSVKKQQLPSSKKARADRVFDPMKYSTRLIGLKFAYLGKRYNGFEYHANNTTPLPTIEEELWKALNKCRLIFPKDTHPLHPGEVNWEGCEYSKCGRTDKGVSAFGQVIGIRVRSNRPLRKIKVKDSIAAIGDVSVETPLNNQQYANGLEISSPPLSPAGYQGRKSEDLSIADEEYEDALPFDSTADEIQYPQLLNRLLPSNIRILAWCPAPPLDFSARFSCRERQYKYFFTQPAFPPTSEHLEVKTKTNAEVNVKNGWLDIEAMRDGARNFIGLHDFRNFCKIDASKQITNFNRRIFYADIVQEDRTATLGFVNGMRFQPKDSDTLDESPNVSPHPQVYSFTLHGSAFLWHQVRHMVAVLFLVGQGLEAPSIISELLNVKKNPRRPMYEIASETPLVLWNCVFPYEDDAERKDALKWLYIGDEAGKGDAKYGSQGILENIWGLWRESKVDEVLAGTLFDVVAAQGEDVGRLTVIPKRGMKSQKVFDGGNRPKLQGSYIPVMEKPQLESPETINEKYAMRLGFESSAEMKELGYRRLKKPPSILDDDDE